MTDRLHKQHHILIAAYALTMLGAFILAIHPIQWLVNSWRDPSYDSNGLWIFICVSGLFLWSITSNITTAQTQRNQQHVALILLIATAIIRLLGQVLAINIVGAIALIIDVYALSLLMNLSNRKRAVSSGWLAIMFAFSLPLERVIQRTIGYALQHVSADGACIVLSTFFESVACEGIRILINGTDVLVDLPCSGARSTLLLLLLFSMFMALHRPNFMHGALGLILTMLCALIANVIRITMLAIGIAYPTFIFDLNIMHPPWHDLIGIIALAIGCLPIIWGIYALAPSKDKETTDALHISATKRHTIKPQTMTARSQFCTALIFIVSAVIIVNIPKKPIDISRSFETISLPDVIGNQIGTPIELQPHEAAYFTQFGGAAAKMQYGNRSLMIVKTSAPLRHLHAPDECLRGIGFDIEYVGLNHTVMPTAIYKATAPDSSQWRIAVSFISNNNHITTNVSEAVWRWLHHPNENWSAIQRIVPWHEQEAALTQWDHDIVTALDLSINPESILLYQSY